MNYVLTVGAEAQYIVLVYNSLLRYSEFFAGCLAGQWFLARRAQRATSGPAGRSARRQRDAVIVACAVAIGLRIWMPDYTGPSLWLWLLDVSVKYAVFIVPFTAVILAVASGRNLLSGLLEHRWMVLLGEASYALYMIHWPVTSFLRMGYLGDLASPAVHALFLLATVGAAVLCYRWVELPWRQRLRGAGTPLAAPAAAER